MSRVPGAIRRTALVVVLFAASSCSAVTAGDGPDTGPSPAPAAATAASAQLSTAPALRFDTAGRQLDAHDGQITEAGGTFYLYGTAYGCGFQWTVGGFCGVNVYSSPDLRSWTNLGTAFDPRGDDWQAACAAGCFRPHVVRVAGRYVMWVNVAASPGSSYRVLTSDRPEGPFTWQPGSGRVAVTLAGDENLFVDDDGSAYIVMTDIEGTVATDRSHEIVLQRLTPDGLDATGDPERLPGVGFVEAPSLWKRDGTYHLAISDPACPYCSGVGITVFDSTSPMSGYGPGYQVVDAACGGQVTGVSRLTVDGQPTDVYQTDRWVVNPGEAITWNQSLSTQAWNAFTYGDDGRVLAQACDAGTSASGPRPSGYRVLAPGGSSDGQLTGSGDATVVVWLARQRGAAGTATVTVAAEGGTEVGRRDLDVAELAWSLQPVTVDVPEGLAGPLSVTASWSGPEPGLLAVGADAAGMLATAASVTG